MKNRTDEKPRSEKIKKTWGMLFIASMALLAFLLSGGSRIISSPAGWEKSFFISGHLNGTESVRAISSGSYVAAVYESTAGEKGVFISVSFDGGLTFLKPARIYTTQSVLRKKPTLSMSPSGKLCAAWQEYDSESMLPVVYYSFSGDFGAGWSEPRRLMSGAGTELLPQVLYDSAGVLHFFYHSYSGKNINLFHSTLDESGRISHRGPLAELGEGQKGVFFPAIEISGRDIYIVWQGKSAGHGDSMYFVRSGDSGKSWSSVKRLTGTSGSDSSPALCFHSNTLFLAYQNTGADGRRINLLIGREGGRRWETAPRSVSAGEINSYSPVLVSREDEIYVLWYDSRERFKNVYVRRLSVRDDTFGEEQKISADRDSEFPEAVVSGQRVIVFWEQTGRIRARCTDIHVNPPLVFSSTHPEGRWSRSAVAEIEWKAPQDESGISGFAAISNPLPDFNPTIRNLNGTARRSLVPGLVDGITYFHIRAIDGAGNMSRTIHYRILASITPPPMPIVSSTTHGKDPGSGGPDAVFTWEISESERLRGFLYSLSKDTIRVPDIFTEEMGARFRGLDEGLYFLSVRSVDRALRESDIADFPFTVGSAEMSEELISGIVSGRIGRKSSETQAAPSPLPDIRFPFDPEEGFTGSGFTADISVSGLKTGIVEGYSYMLGSKEAETEETVNLTSPVLNFENLVPGAYHISLKARFSYRSGAQKKFAWTRAVSKKFIVRESPGGFAMMTAAGGIMERVRERALPLALLCAVALFSFVLSGIMDRLIFYFKNTARKIKIFISYS